MLTGLAEERKISLKISTKAGETQDLENKSDLHTEINT